MKRFIDTARPGTYRRGKKIKTLHVRECAPANSPL